MKFRQKGSGQLAEAEPGTKMYKILNRSAKWEPVEDKQAPPPEHETDSEQQEE